MPEEVDSQVLLHNFVSLQGMLSQYPSNQDVLGHRRMTDPTRLSAMEFLQLLVSSTHSSQDRRIGILAAISMVRMSLESGLCNVSPIAFGIYGTVLVHGKTKDYDQGYKYGKLAIQILLSKYN